MTETLKPYLAQTLDAIRRFIAAHGYPPALRELNDMCGVASTSVMDYRLRQLEQAGAIRRTPGIARSIVVLAQSAPALEAGPVAPPGAAYRAVFMRTDRLWRTVTWLVRGVEWTGTRLTLTLDGAQLRGRRWDRTAQRAATRWAVEWAHYAAPRLEGSSSVSEWRDGGRTLVISLADVRAVEREAQGSVAL